MPGSCPDQSKNPSRGTWCQECLAPTIKINEEGSVKMITRNHKSSVCPVLIASVVCTLLAVTLLPAVTQAAPLALPPRPTPQPAPISHTTSPSRPPAGGFIELRFQTNREGIRSIGQWQGLWTVVQEQDGLGNWQSLEEGWQGTFDEFSCDRDENVCEGKKTWWVARADFGQGPFRWVVYQRRGGEPLAQSETFYLPRSTGESVKVEASFAP